MSYRTREVACPTCGAGIGDVCRDGQGDEVQAHTTRIRLASGDTTERRFAELTEVLTRVVVELNELRARVRDLEEHASEMSGYAPLPCALPSSGDSGEGGKSQ